MMQSRDPSMGEPRPLPDDRVSTLGDEDLTALIAVQRAEAADSERAFVHAREHFDRARKALRLLETEEERRRLAASGAAPAPPPDPKARRKRSTTGMDAVLGRDGIDPDAPFARFHIFSLQRQEILLNPSGDAANQALGFVDRDTGALREARTFGEARGLQDAGHQLGRPGIPLQRQAIWYIAESKSGWLRLDQMFVEQEGE
ncbi:MAG TPA: hypothetical protein VNL71_21705 [Chloroflexota bacterium]|nr:hypothetical protein [Chloroflexota bacterium]